MGGSTIAAKKERVGTNTVVALLVALVGCAVGTDGAPQALREDASSDKRFPGKLDRDLQEVSSSV